MLLVISSSRHSWLYTFLAKPSSHGPLLFALLSFAGFCRPKSPFACMINILYKLLLAQVNRCPCIPRPSQIWDGFYGRGSAGGNHVFLAQNNQIFLDSQRVHGKGRIGYVLWFSLGVVLTMVVIFWAFFASDRSSESRLRPVVGYLWLLLSCIPRALNSFAEVEATSRCDWFTFGFCFEWRMSWPIFLLEDSLCVFSPSPGQRLRRWWNWTQLANCVWLVGWLIGKLVGWLCYAQVCLSWCTMFPSKLTLKMTS